MRRLSEDIKNGMKFVPRQIPSFLWKLDNGKVIAGCVMGARILGFFNGKVPIYSTDHYREIWPELYREGIVERAVFLNNIEKRSFKEIAEWVREREDELIEKRGYVPSNDPKPIEAETNA